MDFLELFSNKSRKNKKKRQNKKGKSKLLLKPRIDPHTLATLKKDIGIIARDAVIGGAVGGITGLLMGKKRNRLSGALSGIGRGAAISGSVSTAMQGIDHLYNRFGRKNKKHRIKRK